MSGARLNMLVLDERTIDELNADVLRLRTPTDDDPPALPRNMEDAFFALRHAIYHGSDVERRRRALRLAAIALRSYEEGLAPDGGRFRRRCAMSALVIIESPFAPRLPHPAATCHKVCGVVGFKWCADFITVHRAWQAEVRAEIERNKQYARAALRDSLKRGESPYASHLLYTQAGVLDDTKPEERELGIVAGFAWRAVAKKTAVYTDFGISPGMELGIKDAIARGVEVEYRQLPGWAR